MKNTLRIITLAKPLYLVFTTITILIVIIAFIDLCIPLYTKQIVDVITSELTTKNGTYSQLTFLLLIIFFLNIISNVVTSISNRLGDHFAGKLRQFLTYTFYQHILSLPQTYFDSELSGKIVNQLNRGISSIQTSFNVATNFILPSILQSILTISIMAFYSQKTAFFTLLLFPIYLYLSYRSSLSWGKHESEKNTFEDSTRGRITEVIENIKLVKSFTMQSHELHKVNAKLTSINRIYAIQSTTFHWFDFARNASLTIILLLINITVFSDTFKGILTIGEMVLILQLILQARRPLFAMSFILTQLQTAENGSKEYFSILDLPSTEPISDTNSYTKFPKPSIAFSHVSFSYEKSREIITDISFKLNAKEKIALVGHSGAGKTTIVNLILKLYNTSSGNITLNSINYTQLSTNTIRGNISLVFQENELFSSTIAENVAYGLPNATDDQIISALKKANAYQFVQRLSHGIHTTIGERGIKLSGGQKQRIQIARAILKDAPILILDEATSSLDSESEREVQSALDVLMQNKLVIIIAHRFSTIQSVDRIFVLDNGTIVDSGTPKELARKKGIYSDLLKYQIEGNKKLLAGYELY